MLKRLTLVLIAPALASAEPIVINDAMLLSSFQKGLGKLAEAKEHPPAAELAEAVKDVPTTVEVSIPTAAGSPEDPTLSVFMIGSVYKCGKCDKWHIGGVATAWALSEDGLMVTNHHVFEKAKGGVMGVCDRKGKIFPITEILAADPNSDSAVFRVEGDGFKPLPLGETAEIGSKVHVISNPNRRFFTQTFGEVSRYHMQPKRRDKKANLVMSITADYAKGSSGGPVLNEDGEVIGMVSSTQSIYYESNNGTPKGPLQMVIKNCVPVKSIRRLTTAGESAKTEAQR